MNVFITDRDPTKAAAWLDDVRNNSQIREHTQMLSIAVWLLHPDPQKFSWGPCPCNFSKGTAYQNHPSSRWVRSSKESFKYTLEYALALCDLREKATNKIHSCYIKLENAERVLHELDWSKTHYVHEPPFVSEPNYSLASSSLSIEQNYRNYLSWKWSKDKKTPVWKIGIKPEWA
jgi:hypothetical protein